MTTKNICPTCKKDLVVLLKMKGSTLYQCGHMFADSAPLETINIHDFKNISGTKSAMPFQESGVTFLEGNNVNGLIADAMGLGKTIQALLALKNYREKLTPTLLVVKSATLPNWISETKDWFDNKPTTIYPIQGYQLFIPPGFDLYVISQDSLFPNALELIKMGFKCIVVDECHGFKDQSAKRSLALSALITGRAKYLTRVGDDTYQINTEDGAAIPHKIFLSGTPIMNRASEYFPILNYLMPENFPSLSIFKRQWLEQDEKGRWSRLSHYRVDKFRRLTAKYILRREKREVLKDLPPFSRHFEMIEIEDERIRKSYNRELGLFESFMTTNRGANNIELLGWLARMRKITGMAKIPVALDFVREFHESAQLEKMIDPDYPDKLAIGIHHIDVRDNLHLSIENSLKLSGEDDAFTKQKIINEFSNDPTKKDLIINMLAGGTGTNIQACANTLLLERQWNPANEEQFESRFDRHGQKYPVTATYIVAAGTVDQFFHEIVEEKRRIFGSTISNQWSINEDGNGIRELVNRTLNNPLK